MWKKTANSRIDAIPSTRRNPILADVFQRLGYMERKGSGLTKIIEAYKAAYNYSEEKEPQFLSSRVEFTVTLKNLNYGVNDVKTDVKVGVNNDVKNKVNSNSDRDKIILNYEKSMMQNLVCLFTCLKK